MIEFVLNNKLIKTDANAGMTLIDFIRSEQQLKGTKIGCREGDCGACTVLVGSLNNKDILYKSITSCISPLGNAHGKHIVTVEGINLEDRLNTVQIALKNNNATQCGFCTPGFVMSLIGLGLQNILVSKEDAIKAISGNICRCTGYKSIEKSAYQIYDKLTKMPFSNRLNWLVDNSYLPNYFLAIADKLKKIKNHTPADIEGVLVAGGTDLYVQNADALAEADVNLVYQSQQLAGITFYKDRCIVGAETTVSDLFYNDAMLTYFPDIRNFLKLVSSEPIRNMATIAGNFVNASPIGDLTIFFLALNASITLQNKSHSLRTILLKDFYKGYKKLDLKPDEHIVNIAFNVPKVKYKFNFEKVSKRTHLDIASVNSAIQMSVSNNKVDFVYFSLGGVAPVPFYLTETCQFLTGKTLSVEILKEATQILQQEIKPISDVRGDETYKRLLARQLFYAHFLKLFPKTFQILELVN
ncbi:MAG: FAD binding domain-containing protein [Flavobacteriaceae bacterium]|nr:FAD binding domain-containing protein [Flavobacteriaceae bacterium]